MSVVIGYIGLCSLYRYRAMWLYYWGYGVNRLKDKRVEKGMTQIELANKSHVSIQMIKILESGTYQITSSRYTTLMKLARALNCEIKDFM